jgi:hypothetical protein
MKIFKKSFIYFAGIILLTAVLILPSISSSLDDVMASPRLKTYYDYLVKIDHCPYNIGFLLEELVRFDLQKEWDPQIYDITGGLELYAPNGFSIGEIDILVMRKKDKKVMLIGEAKMWRDLPAGLIKAKSQLKRLKDAIENKKYSNLYFKPDPALALDSSIFDGPVLYKTYSSKGGVEVGFDKEIDISTTEGRILGDLCTIKHYEKTDYADNKNYQAYLEFFKKFKSLPNDDKVLAAIVAKLHLMKKFPQSDYDVLEDLAYFGDDPIKELGHVKLAVRQKSTGNVVYAANLVWGWNDITKGFKVYTNFLNEFKNYRDMGAIKLYKADRPRDYQFKPADNDNVILMEIIGPNGSKQQGFTKELDINEDSVFWLRKKTEGRI